MQQFIAQIRNLDNDSLLKLTREDVAEERRVGVRILHELREIERRRLYSEQGFQSLFDFCTRGLGYSEGAAQRRIQAARLLGEMPELEQKIQQGKLSLSVVGQAQTFFRQEAKQENPIGLDGKREILRALEGKSSREAEKELLSRTSQPAAASVREKVREVSEEVCEIRFGVDRKLREDLETLKGLLAHKYSNLSYGELIRVLADLALEKLDPARGHMKPKQNDTTSLPPTSAVKRYIPISVRRAVWKRDQGKCVRCDSRYAVQIDHILEFALGGTHAPGNLRLLCRSCNQAKAIRVFGQEKMDVYLNRRLRKANHTSS